MEKNNGIVKTKQEKKPLTNLLPHLPQLIPIPRHKQHIKPPPRELQRQLAPDPVRHARHDRPRPFVCAELFELWGGGLVWRGAC
jgi:hypothetical protein